MSGNQQPKPRGWGRRSLAWLRRGVLWIVVFQVAAAVVGAGYQTIGLFLDQRDYPPPGELYDVGGYKMHMVCRGEGSPTVVLDSGAILFSSGWSWVMEELAGVTRVCAPDRAGLGWSDLGPEPYDGNQATDELHLLLTAAGVEMPFVYVGHSLGGMLGRIYAERYPDELAGLVMIDPGEPEILLEEIGKTGEEAIRPCGIRCPLAHGAASLGLVRLFINTTDFLDDPEFPALAIEHIQARMATADVAEFLASMGRYVPRMARQTMANQSFGDLPVSIVYSGEFGSLLGDSDSGKDLIADRERYKAAWTHTVKRSNYGTGPFAIPGANHLSVIAYQRYAAQVAEYIVKMVEFARAAAPMREAVQVESRPPIPPRNH